MTKEKLLNILAAHHGRERGISMDALSRLCGVDTEHGRRHLRKLVSQLREEGIAVCATPSAGYFIAETPGELMASCAFLHARAMHSLLLASRLQRISLPELVGQLKLNKA